jgi:DDE superfamily endonuclease
LDVILNGVRSHEKLVLVELVGRSWATSRWVPCEPAAEPEELLDPRAGPTVPAALDVHLVIDNYATYKHAKVRGWRARQPRLDVYHTPTYASWLTQIERWFGILRRST